MGPAPCSTVPPLSSLCLQGLPLSLLPFPLPPPRLKFLPYFKIGTKIPLLLSPPPAPSLFVFFLHQISVNNYLHFFTPHSVLFFFLNFLFYIGEQLINNVVLVSGAQQSESVIHIHVPTLFQILFPYRSLQSSLCCTAGPY